MKNKTLFPFFAIMALVVIVSLACGTVTPTPANTAVSNATTPAGNNTGGGSVSSLADVKKATIQIESEGTFIDPQVGLVVNGAGRGSGFIIDPSGIAVTANHVVTGSALIKVWVGEETTPHTARILGVSECSDLAVIKIEGDNFPYLSWYGKQVSTGLEVYAAGFPLGEPQFSLTKGIISKERADGQTTWASLDYLLEHDATINPGNSGGPLVDANGRVVGINNSFRSSANQYFAIDENMAKPIVDQLKTGVDINSIGVNGEAVIADDKSLSGVWVASVKSGSPADKTGVKAGDILYQMEGLVLATDGTMKDYCDILKSHKSGDVLSVTIIRFNTKELLEGQLNGRELAVTGTFGGSTDSAGGTDIAPTQAGTQVPTPEPTKIPAFFTEHFKSKTLPNWSGLLMDGDGKNVSYSWGDDYLTFDVEGANIWYNLIYTPYTYTNVILEARVENRGKNNNFTKLICRITSEGWYEFDVSPAGEYIIQAYSEADHGYLEIFGGGSAAIKTGKDTNVYTVGCVGQTLTLIINGVTVKEITEKKYNFQNGKVGIGITSKDVFPIIERFDYLTIAQP